MAVARSLTKCPFCLEKIAVGATRCKHCQADLAGASQTRAPMAKLNTFRTGFLSGILFMLALIALAYLHFNGG